MQQNPIQHSLLENLKRPLEVVIPSSKLTLLKKILGSTVFEALCHLPSGIMERRSAHELTHDLVGKNVAVRVRIVEHIFAQKKGQPHRIHGTTVGFNQLIELTFFQQNVKYYIDKRFSVGKVYTFLGKLDALLGHFRLMSPRVSFSKADEPLKERLTEPLAEPLKEKSPQTVEAIYPLTAGVFSSTVTQIMKHLLIPFDKMATDEKLDWHDPKYNYPSLMASFAQAHTPTSAQDITLESSARARLLHDEILAHNLSLRLHRLRTKSVKAHPIPCIGESKKTLLGTLPFTLTQGQEKAILDIEDDLRQKTPMLRLLQGDVGCGKTIVAAVASAHAIDAGLQVAILVPTDLLANQHFENFKAYFEPLFESPGINIELLTGRIKGKARKKILTQLETGATSIVIGTHALIQEGVEFQRLGLIIVDEQHRFGVGQRAKLVQKGFHPHVLSMTATPIPRTLLMTNYGDVDLSIIAEKPKGRKEIATTLHPVKDIPALIQKLHSVLSPTHKAYWVCPMIEESDTSDLAAAKMRFETLQHTFGERVALLHGKMKGEEKQNIMEKFKHGDVDLLVSTTVIEVGVDVKTANLMIIEHAERFGLAQLHQLRGRVGRSSAASKCLLLYNKLTPTAKERLLAMRDSNDGFFLAEADLKLRGGGDVTGYKQSGFPEFRFYKGDDHQNFQKILERAREDVHRIVTELQEKTHGSEINFDVELDAGVSVSLNASLPENVRSLLSLYGKEELDMLTRGG